MQRPRAQNTVGIPLARNGITPCASTVWPSFCASSHFPASTTPRRQATRSADAKLPPHARPAMDLTAAAPRRRSRYLGASTRNTWYRRCWPTRPAHVPTRSWGGQSGRCAGSRSKTSPPGSRHRPACARTRLIAASGARQRLRPQPTPPHRPALQARQLPCRASRHRHGPRATRLKTPAARWPDRKRGTPTAMDSPTLSTPPPRMPASLCATPTVMAGSTSAASSSCRPYRRSAQARDNAQHSHWQSATRADMNWYAIWMPQPLPVSNPSATAAPRTTAWLHATNTASPAHLTATVMPSATSSSRAPPPVASACLARSPEPAWCAICNLKTQRSPGCTERAHWSAQTSGWLPTARHRSRYAAGLRPADWWAAMPAR